MMKTFRGQGTSCKGTLRITLTGPQGCGKSLVVKFLLAVLPLLGVDTVVIQTRQTRGA